MLITYCENIIRKQTLKRSMFSSLFVYQKREVIRGEIMEKEKGREREIERERDEITSFASGCRHTKDTKPFIDFPNQVIYEPHEWSS